jgi:hypothetical protein
VIPPFLWFRARPKPPRSGVPDQATLSLVPLNPDGSPRPQHSVQRLVSIDVKSGVEKQLATLDPPPDTVLAGSTRFEGFDESTFSFDRLMRRFQRAGTAVVRMVGNSPLEPDYSREVAQGQVNFRIASTGRTQNRRGTAVRYSARR